MSEYKEPKLPKITHKTNLESLLKIYVDAIAWNKAEYEKRQNAYRATINSATHTYGANAKQVHYLRNNPPETPPDLNRVIKQAKKKYQQAVAYEERRVKAAEYLKDYVQRRKEATARLIDHNYVVGVDFLESRAISFEKELINKYGFLKPRVEKEEK